ncbi:uncharacterized protein LOC112591877 [Melanaphis sacchari]|uniref:uncharacterized protein LOC112591877 n=1 Tax=Melanaphis sacchari TaxID=742174 RepID=UPI000DC147B5|nr:uncharacterized protein LOC112591877 [Melanaphis sacchari]
MESLKKSLTMQSNTRFMSVGDLTINFPYPIIRMENRDTQYGLTVHCVLECGEDGGLIEVYLPRSIKIGDDEVREFNRGGENRMLNLIFKGRRGRSFNIGFQ